jgi:hypothetical protein
MSRIHAARTEENKPMLKWQVLPMVLLAYLASTVSAGATRDRDHDRLPDRSAGVCSDGADNDGDGLTDMADYNCGNPQDTSEAHPAQPSWTTQPRNGERGSFEAQCFYSHRDMLDPIVFPGQNPASHMHDFVGAQNLNENSTNDSIRSDPNNCIRGGGKVPTVRTADKSAYWVPSLLVNDEEVNPTWATAADGGPGAGAVGVYYVGNRRVSQNMKLPPADFRVIAGNPMGAPAGAPGEVLIYNWYCPGGQAAPPTGPGGFPTCQTARLDLIVKFADCWDGVRSDSPNHRDHVAYSSYIPGTQFKRCPPSHPVEIPALVLNARYATTGGPTAHLSTRMMGASGGTDNTHADWMNGWDQTVFKKLIDECLNQDLYCGGQDGPVVGHP